MSKIRSAPKCGKKPPEKRLCQSILSRDLKSIYLARGKRFLYATPQTELRPGSAQLLRSISKAKLFSRKMKLPQTRIAFFGGEGGTHSVTPRLKTVHRTVFPEKAPAFSVGSFESLLLQFDKKRRSHKWDLLFLAEKGGLEPPRQFLDRPTPLAGAPRHQLEYFSRLVSGLRLYSLLETAVLNSFLFLCR